MSWLKDQNRIFKYRKIDLCKLEIFKCNFNTRSCQYNWIIRNYCVIFSLLVWIHKIDKIIIVS